ncbi:hypothetical protein BG09_6786 [Bacillus thuringiensis serovar kurstaki str. HD-1]|nr:hypothetical protein HD73_3518 [Bacillus thuringiensis serovar kurstaki str. HD73]EEL55973.1 hypothetical protein bcere0023_23330 [Bacillus cereus Rock4-2]KEH44566.1 hypothetical protein BG09_6786 [Bacillus thuringiensis serovar kurstaki str. HD-1]KLA07611.1 hypothetical protein B4158_2413 [Bacillus cereus]
MYVQKTHGILICNSIYFPLLFYFFYNAVIVTNIPLSFLDDYE